MEKYLPYAGIQSGDKEIDKRVVKTLEQLSIEPSASISRVCGDKHQSKAVYRLLSNAKFKPSQLTKVSAAESVRKIVTSGARTVLIIQDTSVLNYTNLPCTSGLGTICKTKQRTV